MPAYQGAKSPLFSDVFADEKRLLHRSLGDNSREYGVRLRVGEVVQEAKVVNLHCNGACIESEWLHNTPGVAVDELTFFYGKHALFTLQHVSWKWHLGARAGLEFPVADASSGNGLVAIKSHFEPTLSVSDPIKPDWIIFARACEASNERLCFRTSLCNRHLLPGTSLPNACVRLPCLSDIVARLRVTRVTVRDTQLEVLCDWEVADRRHRESMFHFSLFALTEGTRLFPPARKPRRLGPGVRIEPLSSARDYRHVLEVRELAYRDAGIIAEGVKIDDFADEYDKRSLILVARLRGDIIGTARLIRADGPDEAFHFEEDVSADILGEDARSNYLEVSRLAVKPAFHDTEVFLRLVQELGRQCILAGKSGAALARTEQRKTYRQIGWEALGNAIQHPLIPEQTLQLMRLTPSAFLSRQNKAATVYERVIRPVIATLAYAEVFAAPALPITYAMRLRLERSIVLALRVLRRCAIALGISQIERNAGDVPKVQ